MTLFEINKLKRNKIKNFDFTRNNIHSSKSVQGPLLTYGFK